MKDKKGIFTISEILGLIIAAIGIAIVAYAAYKLYAVSVNQESENAKNLLNVIERKIDNLNNNEVGRFQIRGIKDWFLVGWGEDDIGRIDKCFFKSCICICKGDRTDLENSCQENGFCRNFNFGKIGVFEFKKIIGKDIIDSVGNTIKEEDVVKDIFNPRYKESRIWYRDGFHKNPLLNDACPQFYESNLAEILIYEDKNSLAILKISEMKDELVRFLAGCGK